MAVILGLDPSIRKSGYCVLDTDAPYNTLIERGRLYTSPKDGILTLRLIKQQRQVRELMEKYSIDFVAMEAPYLGGDEAEHLFALNQFIHHVFYDRGTYVIAFPPTQLKSLSLPTVSSQETGKNHYVVVAQERFDLLGERLTDDEADAMNAAFLGRVYYQWKFENKLTTEDLLTIGPTLHPLAGELRAGFINIKYTKLIGPRIHKAFAGQHEFTRGRKKGTVEYTGLMYRENELFWDYTAIKRRQEKYAPKI